VHAAVWSMHLFTGLLYVGEMEEVMMCRKSLPKSKRALILCRPDNPLIGGQLDDAFAEVLYPGCGGLEKLRASMEAAEMRMLDSQTKQKVGACTYSRATTHWWT